jgi:hypothetical protein
MYERNLQKSFRKWPLGKRWENNITIIVGRPVLRMWIGFTRFRMVYTDEDK